MAPLHAHLTCQNDLSPAQIAPEVVDLQQTRRWLVGERLHTEDALKHARWEARCLGSRRAAVVCLAAGRHLAELDVAIADVNRQIAAVQR